MIKKCLHNFRDFQVPAGDSCMPIYHGICIHCGWDRTKKYYVPNNIWAEWIIPQMHDNDRNKIDYDNDKKIMNNN